MKGDTATIRRDDIPWIDEEAVPRPASYVHPWAHLSNLHNLNILNRVELVTKFASGHSRSKIPDAVSRLAEHYIRPS